MQVGGDATFGAGSGVFLKFTAPVGVGDSYKLLTAGHVTGWDVASFNSDAHGLAFAHDVNAAGTMAGVTISGITGTNVHGGGLSGNYYGSTVVTGPTTKGVRSIYLWRVPSFRIEAAKSLQ